MEVDFKNPNTNEHIPPSEGATKNYNPKCNCAICKLIRSCEN